jgi:hypothetical protein
VQGTQSSEGSCLGLERLQGTLARYSGYLPCRVALQGTQDLWGLAASACLGSPLQGTRCRVRRHATVGDALKPQWAVL